MILSIRARRLEFLGGQGRDGGIGIQARSSGLSGYVILVLDATLLEEVEDLLLVHVGDVDDVFSADSLLRVSVVGVGVDVQGAAVFGDDELDARVTAIIINREVRIVPSFLVDKLLYLREPVQFSPGAGHKNGIRPWAGSLCC